MDMARLQRKSYTANEAVGIKINELMFRNRVSRKKLGELLGITGQGVSRKVLGQSSWTLDELFCIADYFNIAVADLLPRRVPQTQETPDSFSRTEGSNLVAGAGFEPTTSGL
ncbi:helix-turn-helix domain-containing protein [Corynebacterium ulcerans]|uniref:helix-turn-helix domain-containing protein n=1 Tax=Corynebacterium ulcerans TaxID=65058 RepID=UPI000C794291